MFPPPASLGRLTSNHPLSVLSFSIAPELASILRGIEHRHRAHESAHACLLCGATRGRHPRTRLEVSLLSCIVIYEVVWSWSQ